MQHHSKRRRVPEPTEQVAVSSTELPAYTVLLCEAQGPGCLRPCVLPASTVALSPYLSGNAAWPRTGAREWSVRMPDTRPSLTPGAWNMLVTALLMLSPRDAMMRDAIASMQETASQDGMYCRDHLSDLQAMATAADYLFPGDSMPPAMVQYMQALFREVVRETRLQPEVRLLPFMFPWLQAEEGTWRDFLTVCCQAIVTGGAPPRHLVMPPRALLEIAQTMLATKTKASAEETVVVPIPSSGSESDWLYRSLASKIGNTPMTLSFVRCRKVVITGPWLRHLLRKACCRFFGLPSFKPQATDDRDIAQDNGTDPGKVQGTVQDTAQGADMDTARGIDMDTARGVDVDTAQDMSRRRTGSR